MKVGDIMRKAKELWTYQEEEKVWVGKYLNSHNISHWHSDNEIVYVNKGSLEVMIEGNKYTLNKGDSLFINSKKIHNMDATKENTLISIIIFDNSLIKKHFQKYELESPILSNDYNLPSIYDDLFLELTSKPQFYVDSTKLTIQSLLLNIYRNEKIIPSKQNKKMNENLLNLIEQINLNYAYFTFEDAVKIMNMNYSYFSRFFHNVIGIPFAKYLNCVKVEKACELLLENKDTPIKQIADLCGFTTIRNFNRIFKSYTGYSPKEIPDNYVFNGLAINTSLNSTNPTSSLTKLVEFSSPHN